jgi:hypothetical protein
MSMCENDQFKILGFLITCNNRELAQELGLRVKIESKRIFAQAKAELQNKLNFTEKK